MSNNLIRLVSYLVLVQFFVPTASFAALQNSTSGRGQADNLETRMVQTRTCNNFEIVQSQMLNRIIEQANQFKKRQTERLGSSENRWTGKLHGLANARIEQNKRHDHRFSLMLNRVKNDEERVIVERFKTEVEEALEVRRLAVDEAMDVYLQALQELSKAYQSHFDQLITTFTAEIEEVLTETKKTCEDENVDGVAVRKNLNQAVKAAHERLQEDWGNSSTFNDEIKALVEKRNEAFRIAWVKFKVDIEVAHNELKNRLQELRSSTDEQNLEDEADTNNEVSELDGTENNLEE